MAHIKESIDIGSDMDQIHTLVSKVDKWPLWSVSLGTVRHVEGDGDPGTVVWQTYSLVGKDIDYVSTVKESGPKAEGGFVWRAERSGELPGWLSFDIDPHDGGAMVAGELEYELPGGMLGKAADHLGAKAAMEHSLRHALRTLKELAEENWVAGVEIKAPEGEPVCDE
jgi:coenzyme Q-binding protein COQ10